MDRLAVLLFAALHDSMRAHDGRDPGHGPRAAKLARELLEDGPLLSGERLEALLEAIEDHDAGATSDDPTVAACWDSDRLNLHRVGIKPDPDLLSTEAARNPETIARAKALQRERHSWDGVLVFYGVQSEPTKGSMT